MSIDKLTSPTMYIKYLLTIMLTSPIKEEQNKSNIKNKINQIYVISENMNLSKQRQRDSENHNHLYAI